MKRFNVVLPSDDAGVTLAPMKEWLRSHPNEIPRGLDATSSTSHQLRNGLRKMGWTVRETATEVQLVMPGGATGDLDQILGAADDEAIEEAVPEVAAFQLEYQLRDFLSQNLSTVTVAGKRVRLYVDPTGRDGVEYPTAVGPIDILAVDEQGNFFVFELKRALSPDSAIGQLARYMGWVKQTIGVGREVHGVIVARAIGDKLRYAVTVMPHVSLFEYEVSFRLNPAHEFAK